MRGERPHAPFELVRGAPGIEQPVGGLDLLGVGHPLAGLLAERGLGVEHLHQQLAAERRQPRGQAAVVVVGPDRLGALEAERPGVELGGGTHDRHAGLLVAGLDRPLDRRRPAPARQQRRMHVEHLVLGEQRLAEQRPVGADQHRLGLGRGDRRARVLGVHVGGLDRLDAEPARVLGQRRRLQPPAAPARAVGPGDHEQRPVWGRGEAVEHLHRELRGAQVDRAHRVQLGNGARGSGG